MEKSQRHELDEETPLTSHSFRISLDMSSGTPSTVRYAIKKGQRTQDVTPSKCEETRRVLPAILKRKGTQDLADGLERRERERERKREREKRERDK
jgi:hypothetical protein